MAAVDALTLRVDRPPGEAARWAAAVAFALALHGGALVYLRQSEAPAGFESQVPVEMDLMPPPSGAAQMDNAGAETSLQKVDETQQLRPDQVEDAPQPQDLREITSEDAPPPPPDTVAVTADPPPDRAEIPLEELTEADQPEVAQTDETPPEKVVTPPDVEAEATVTLPPDTAVAAREEEPVVPQKPKPPVIRPAEPKREPPKRAAKPVEEKPEARPRSAARIAEQDRKATPALAAGGRSGISNDPGAARAAASNYGSTIRALVAAQKRCAAGVNGAAVVSFTINRSGRLTSVSASGGGVAAEAQSAVRRAAGSFPAMPAEMTGGSVSYTLPMKFSRC